ncbi:hypothetical protein [Janthinobacterium sp.]|uniref:hypothetical protein n=1 Tax=Janthinobacterium sp. TaxID=1871054 RepID=UPI00293D7715|nr:hypothetical protein [Janthinobacterium sp.]
MNSTFIAWLKYLSRICGFDTADSFPPGHPYARTRWNAAYFDIASDVKPDEIERRLCAAITNTPTVFAYITHPTRRMQRALFGVLAERGCRKGNAAALAHLLIAAYRSPHTPEALPGLRAAILSTEHDEPEERARSLLAFLAQMQSPYDVIEAEN